MAMFVAGSMDSILLDLDIASVITRYILLDKGGKWGCTFADLALWPLDGNVIRGIKTKILKGQNLGIVLERIETFVTSSNQSYGLTSISTHIYGDVCYIVTTGLCLQEIDGPIVETIVCQQGHH